MESSFKFEDLRIKKEGDKLFFSVEKDGSIRELEQVSIPREFEEIEKIVENLRAQLTKEGVIREGERFSMELKEWLMSPPQVDVKALIDKARHVGNVFAWQFYGMEEIPITLKKGLKLPLGAYVFIKDEDGLPIIYQVASPKYYRYSYEFEKRLIAHGGISKDELHTYDFSGILLGKLLKDGRIEPPKYPIPPLSEVYECTPPLIRIITRPSIRPILKIGVDPITSQDVEIALWPLIRQGLLISGAQGTGKTTALLTLICRALRAYPHLRFLALDWTGELTSLKELKSGHPEEKALKLHVEEVPWDRLLQGIAPKEPELLLRLIREDDPRVVGAVGEVLRDAIVVCGKSENYPTKANLKKIVGEVVEIFDNRGKLIERRVVGIFKSRKPETIESVRDVIDRSKWLPEKEPEKPLTLELFKTMISDNNVIIIDFSTTKEPNVPDDLELKKMVAATIVDFVWNEARSNKDFGCIIVSDEVHHVAPEKFYGEINPIWIRLATEGGRNGCPLWVVARRLSLVSKSVTTELQQNFFCFNVEDVDRRRIMEDLGETFASLLGKLPPGEAVVKSAVGLKTPGQVVHVVFDKVLEPTSTRYGLEERFKPKRDVEENATMAI